MRHTLITLAALSSLAGCAVIVVPDGDGGVHYKSAFSSDALQGNGQHAVESRQVATLDGVDINGGMQVEIRVGQATALQVEGDSNIVPLLRTDASGGTLRIWVDGNVRTQHPLRIVYSTPALRQLSANGSGALTVSGLHGGPLELSLNGSRAVRLSGSVERLDARLNGSGGLNASALRSGTITAGLNGSGRLELGQLDGEALHLELRGSGGASASGRVRNMTVRLNGSGSADLAGLSSQSADLSSNGSGGIAATVTQSLVASANGSGGVTVYGNPAQRNVSGKRVTVLN
ncbi:head GIN domain-containing protein [Duganella sp.]|uniref:head GIN domain-containing protein n=1 Tax=Duganella sp. TaxID=1904440 RepID=UPI0031CE3245